MKRFSGDHPFRWGLITEYLSTNLHMNRYTSFFKGCHFKNTIVDGYSIIIASRWRAKLIMETKITNSYINTIVFDPCCMFVEGES